MKEVSGTSGKPKFGLIFILLGVAILACLAGAILYFATGHPTFHPTPQPKDNKGALSLPAAPPLPPQV